MEQFTLDEINFLRYLLIDRFTILVAGDVIQNIFGDVDLTKYQSDLLVSIQKKLLGASSY